LKPYEERREGELDKGLHPTQTPETECLAEKYRKAKKRHFHPLHGPASSSQRRTVEQPPLWLRHELEFKVRSFGGEANTPSKAFLQLHVVIREQFNNYQLTISI
jgi:hypothetical protein